MMEDDRTDNPKHKRSCVAPIVETEQNVQSIDGLLELLLEIPDSSSDAIGLALNRVIESNPYDKDKDDVIQRAARFASALEEAAKRSDRRRMAAHNAAAWVLPSELTIKVFSLLDTESVCRAGAACSFLHKCSTDPLCFSNIDLTSSPTKVSDAVASTMIQRAGKDLRSLKLGSHFSQLDKNASHAKEISILTGSCLSPLVADGGASGYCLPDSLNLFLFFQQNSCSFSHVSALPVVRALLKKLCLYNIDKLDNDSLGSALSACPGLLDFEMVGHHMELLDSLWKCPLIECIFFESSARYDCLNLGTCVVLATRFPCLSSLTLRGCALPDERVRVLFVFLVKLKYADFSTSYGFTGEFHRYFDGVGASSSLECLMLRDCIHLRREEVSLLLKATAVGRFARLRHIDVSSPQYPRLYGTRFPELRLLADMRPELSVITDSPVENARTRKKLWCRWAARKRGIRRGERQWRS